MYFVFIVMPLLSVIKVITQGRYSQKNIKTFSDVLIYNTMVFLFSALILSVIFLRQIPPVEVWLFALFSAVANILFQSFYTLAFKNGPITATTIIVSFNIVIVLLTGLIFYNEKWSLLAIIGLLFMFAAFYLIPARTKDKKISLKWIIYVALSFLTTGIFSSFLLVFSKSEFGAMQNEYVAITFSIATILSSLLTLFNVKVKKEPITIKLDYKLPLVALVIGGALGIYNLINVIAFKHFESYILSPIVSGSIMVLTMVVNAIINKEKPTTKMLIGVACAVIAIVFLNL